MSYLEELLPEFRKGAKIRLAYWNKEKFIVLKEDTFVDNANYEYPLSIPETLNCYWELYQEPIDWDCIIKNRCLCYFWDSDNENVKHLGVLKEIEKDGRSKFKSWVSGSFECCRPVRKDEVTFYEVKNDSTN